MKIRKNNTRPATEKENKIFLKIQEYIWKLAKEEGISDLTVLSGMMCFVAKIGMDLKIKKSWLDELLNMVWGKNIDKEDEIDDADQIQEIKQKVYSMIIDKGYKVANVAGALAMLATGAALQAKINKKNFIGSMSSLWEEIQKQVE